MFICHFRYYTFCRQELACRCFCFFTCRSLFLCCFEVFSFSFYSYSFTPTTLRILFNIIQSSINVFALMAILSTFVHDNFMKIQNFLPFVHNCPSLASLPCPLPIAPPPWRSVGSSGRVELHSGDAIHFR